jgi:peptidoglycan/xylan/chitin deacetylase (PgdA/CDA1 family)
VALLRSLLKSFALTLLAGYGWLRIRFVNEPTLLILTYHRILPSDAPERSSEQPGMITTPELLDQHIDLVKRLGAEPVHLDNWIERKNSKKSLPRLAVAFTFDDGWRDNFQYAYPKLEAQRVPATIFLVTQLIDTERTFWPEQILRLLTSESGKIDESGHQWLAPYLKEGKESSLPLPLDKADEVISRLKALPDETIYSLLDETEVESRSNPHSTRDRSILSKQEVLKMAESGLVKFGAHTRNHYRLNLLNEQTTLHAEIVDCFEDMKTFGNSSIPIFCYPNGNITARGEELVRQTYEAACTTKTGWNRASLTDQFELHRFNLHDGNSFSAMRFLATIGRGIL